MNCDHRNVCSVLRRIVLLPAICLAAGLIGCNSASDRTDVAGAMEAGGKKPANSLLEEAVFAKALTKNEEPDKPCKDFYPGGTVYLSLKFKGRPLKGVAGAKFYLEDQLISEAKLDFASVNSGVLFSVGESTFAGFSLKHEKPFPISDKYRVEASFNDQPIGT